MTRTEEKFKVIVEKGWAPNKHGEIVDLFHKSYYGG